jgi:hypothetical protein
VPAQAPAQTHQLINSVGWEMECPLTSARIGLPVGANCLFESGSWDQLEKAR